MLARTSRTSRIRAPHVIDGPIRAGLWACQPWSRPTSSVTGSDAQPPSPQPRPQSRAPGPVRGHLPPNETRQAPAYNWLIGPRLLRTRPCERQAPNRRYASDLHGVCLEAGDFVWGCPCHGRARPGACSTAVSDLNNDPRPLRPSGTVTLPAPAPPITPPALPAPLPQPRNTPKPAGDHTRTHARLSSLGRVRNMPPGRPVRGRPWKADGHTDRATGTDAVRNTSVDTATYRLTVTHADTQRDKKETAPRAALTQPEGRFRWWQVLGSNQRRLSRRFYRPLSFRPSHMPLTSAYAVRGSAPAAAVRDASVRSGLGRPRTGAEIATDGAGGSGYADRPLNCCG